MNPQQQEAVSAAAVPTAFFCPPLPVLRTRVPAGARFFFLIALVVLAPVAHVNGGVAPVPLLLPVLKMEHLELPFSGACLSESVPK